MGHKKMDSFNDVDKYLNYRREVVKKSRSLDWDDSWATDKSYLETLGNLFPCKWCGQKMYAAYYEQGEIMMSCKTPLCPGNVDSGMANQIKKHQFDIREQTNKYLFNSMLRF